MDPAQVVVDSQVGDRRRFVQMNGQLLPDLPTGLGDRGGTDVAGEQVSARFRLRLPASPGALLTSCARGRRVREKRCKSGAERRDGIDGRATIEPN